MGTFHRWQRRKGARLRFNHHWINCLVTLVHRPKGSPSRIDSTHVINLKGTNLVELGA